MEVIVPLKTTGILKHDFPNKGATIGQPILSTLHPQKTLLNFPAVLVNVSRLCYFIKKERLSILWNEASRIFPPRIYRVNLIVSTGYFHSEKKVTDYAQHIPGFLKSPDAIAGLL